MKHILFMQNCFVPDENQFNRLKRSIESLIVLSKKTKTTNYNRYVLSGWIHEDYEREITELVEELNDCLYFTDTYINLLSTNAGKGVACNITIKQYAHEYYWTHLFLFDNDIVFEADSGDLPQILIEQQQELNAISALKYPVISCNFKEHQVHCEGALDFGAKTKHGTMRCSTGNYGCIGGGCWLIDKPHWDKIGGYSTDAIYGKDDGQFYVDTICTKNCMVALSFDVYVIHPSDKDEVYNRFKADTNINRVRKMDYKELTEDSEKFWSKR